MKKICIIGLGYIGLPTAAMFASKGCKVVGVDINPAIINTINSGRIHIEEPGLADLVEDVVKSGYFKASFTPEEADAFIIAVPTPVTKDKKADLSYVDAASKAIANYVKPGNIVVLESTVPPLTVEEIVIPALEEVGININKIFVGHSPERVIPGRVLTELVENDRVVGGINQSSTIAIANLYRIFVKGNILETDCSTAEMVKLMENTYRDVNIALANEFALICEKLGLNVWKAIKLANHHPRVNIHQPGPGVGGHCIAVDPYFIIEKAKEEAKLITLSRETNSTMPHKVVEKVKNILPKGSKITALGAAFKGNIDDIRESPALEIIELLVREGYKVSAYDPYVKEEFKCRAQSLEDALKFSQCILVLVDHWQFAEIDAEEAGKYLTNKIVIDTRNIINESWKEAGFKVHVLGIRSKNIEQSFAQKVV